MDYVEHFYSTVHGYYPFETDDNKIKSQNLINHLIDAGVEPKNILKFVEEAPAVDYLKPSILPEWLWEGSLLKKGTFYYHSILHMKSKPPTWDPRTGKEVVEKFYMEMKIRFTIKDLINYYYGTMLIDPILMDEKRDGGALKYLLDRYSRIDFIEPLDFLLHNIDYAKERMSEDWINNILDINKYEGQVYEMLQSKVDQARLARANQIVWRE